MVVMYPIILLRVVETNGLDIKLL